MIKNFIEKYKNAPLVLKASIAYTICNILQKSLSLITMPLFTRLLTTEQYGQYTIYSSWSSIFSIAITLNLAYGSFNNAMIKYEKNRESYISSIQGIVLLLAILFLIIYLPFSSQINEWLNMSTALILLMVSEIVCQFFIQAWCGLKRFEYKYKSVIIVTIVMSILAPVLALLLVINTTDKGVARIFGYGLINILIGLLLGINNIIKGKKIFSKEFWKFALRFNIPLLVYYFSQVIFNQSDKIMIERICGVDKSAIYSVAYSLAMILTFVLNAINSSYEPWFYEKIKSGCHRENKKMSLIITLVMCFLVLCVIWTTPEIILILSGDKYVEAIWVVPPIAISLILLLISQFFISIEFYYEEKFKMVIASILSALLNIALNFLLLPKFGYLAAGYTTLISYIVFAFCNYIAVFKRISKNGNLYGIFNLKILFLAFMCFVIISYIGVLFYNYWIIRYGVIILTLLFALIFHKKIIKMFKNIKEKMLDKNNKIEVCDDELCKKND